MRRFLLSLSIMVALVTACWADAVSDRDRSEFERIISAQIDAFRADDGPAAYRFASPMIRQYFPTPEIFMSMVKKGYAPVYRPQSFKFGAVGLDQTGNPTQRVTIIGPDGKTYEALYTMQQQPDGTWQINGCRLLEIPGLDV